VTFEIVTERSCDRRHPSATAASGPGGRVGRLRATPAAASGPGDARTAPSWWACSAFYGRWLSRRSKGLSPLITGPLPRPHRARHGCGATRQASLAAAPC